MHIAEKTMPGLGAVRLRISSPKALVQLLDGHLATQMHAAQAPAHSPQGFTAGFMFGVAVAWALKVLASLGLWTLLVQRYRKSGVPA